MSDNHGAESSATVAITVAGVNDAPVAVDDDVTGGVGESVVLDFNGSVNLSDYLDYAFTGFTHYVSAFGDGDNTMAYTYYNNNVASLTAPTGPSVAPTATTSRSMASGRGPTPATTTSRFSGTTTGPWWPARRCR